MSIGYRGPQSPYDYDSMSPNPLDSFKHRTNEMRYQLERLRFQVKDIKITRQYQEYPVLSASSINHRIETNCDTEWELVTDGRTVESIIEAKHESDKIHSRVVQLECDRLKADQIKIDFNTLLKDHPGIKDQYVEFMTMCKLAGFDQKLN